VQPERNPEDEHPGRPSDRNLSRRRIAKWVAGGTLGVILLVVATILLVNAFAGPVVRGRLVRFLESRYKADVNIAHLRIKILPELHVNADQVVVRRRNQPANFPPFFAIRKLSLYGSLMGLLRRTPHVARVELEGLEINIPPRGQKAESNGTSPGDNGSQARQDQQDQKSQNDQKSKDQNDQATAPDVIIREMVADGTILRVYSRKPGKDPLQFTIRQLTMQSVGKNQPMQFDATLENAKPPGLIDSQGRFGPWNADDPGVTPVSGQYTFRNADLSVFRGISGILASDGTYKGPLEQLEVNGWTDTPDFAVGISGNKVHLRTDFHAVVDGTDGDVRLEPVKVRLPNSTLVAKGSVANKPGPGGKPTKGKTISLHVTANGARMEDLLRLALKSAPPLSGTIHLDTLFELPPGDRDVSEKLFLKGEFALDSARFRNETVQGKIRKLSLRGRGINKKEEDGFADERVVSNVKGKFLLKNGVMTLPQVFFEVPGATVHLHGNYGLRSEAMNFKGELRLAAKISQTTDGVKALLLKAVDPLFHRDGAGAVIPIHIDGTRDKPEFGVDMGRVFSRGAKREASK
jgi:hypothetical protein